MSVAIRVNEERVHIEGASFAGLMIADPANFRALVERAFAIASDDETRSNISGLLLEPSRDGSEMLVVATDGHRLHIERMPNPLSSDALPKEGAFLPRESLRKFLRVFRGGRRVGRVNESVNSTSGNILLRRAGGKTAGECVELLARHDYPNWRQIADRVAKSNTVETTLTLSGQEQEILRDALETFAGVHHTTVVELAGDFLNMSYEGGTHRVEISAKFQMPISFRGPATKFAVDPSYLADALAPMGDDCTVVMGEPLEPIHIRSLSGKSHRVVMPKRMKGVK